MARRLGWLLSAIGILWWILAELLKDAVAGWINLKLGQWLGVENIAADEHENNPCACHQASACGGARS
jgi:hypothetical protein